VASAQAVPAPRGALARARRNAWLYRRCLGAHLRSTLEYEADFWIMSVSAVVAQGVGIIFLWAIFGSIPEINGWTFWDVAMIYALVVLSEGLSVLFAQGAWSMAFTVNLGGFDALLLRPFSPVLQVLSSQIGMNGLGNVALGGALLGVSVAHVDVAWTPATIALFVVLVISAALVKVGLNTATNAAAFWIKTPWSMFAFSMHTFGELARFPITIYGIGVRLALSVVLPYAFMSYFPAQAVLSTGTAHWLGFLTPLVAVWCLLLGALVFRRGMLRYESAGN
jgi:ABC-2 type transport system permease protein